MSELSQNLNMKSKALGKDEVMLLLDLILKNKVITSKATNATNNKLKETAWTSIAQEFSATSGDHRRPEQLRLKWENLKKAARKRNALIRKNNLKTGGGKLYIPPDEALDRVASILGVTCSGLTEEFGGDAEPIDHQAPLIEIVDFGPLPEQPSAIVTSDIPVTSAEINAAPKHFIFNSSKTTASKRRKLSEEVQRAKRDKNLALASYFQAKAEKINLENIKLKLEIEKLQNNK